MSTPNSEHDARRRLTFQAFARTLCVTALFLVGADVLFGAVIGKFPAASPNIIGQQNANGLFKLWQFSNWGLSPVVFTGSSQMKMAAVPAQFDTNVRTLSGKSVTSVNVSVLGGSVEISRGIIQGILLPKGVRTIIYGIEIRAVHTNAETDKVFQYAFEQSPVGYALSRPVPWERTMRLWLLQHSAFLQYRNNLSNWLRGDSAPFDNTPVDDRGHAEGYGLGRRNFDTIREQTGSFEIDASARDALNGVLLSCQQIGVRCVLVNMPLHPDSYKVIPAQAETQYEAFLYSAAGAAKIPIWDFTTEACRAYFGDPDFNDVNHLNTAGAARFTRVIAALYVQQIIGKAVPIDTNCVKVSAP